MKKDTDRELPAIVQATTKLTLLEKRMMFHINPGRLVCILDMVTNVCESPDRDKGHT